MGRVSEKITTFLPWPEIEPEAQKQILNVAELPFIFKWVAVMPDCHYGKGATVGTVIATKGAVVPAAVGVDIGCGMVALETPLKRDSLKELYRLREGIERRIPMSAGRNNSKITETAQARIAEVNQVESPTRAHSGHI
jgi:tRNA-splicing ligase RtcB